MKIFSTSFKYKVSAIFHLVSVLSKNSFLYYLHNLFYITYTSGSFTIKIWLYTIYLVPSSSPPTQLVPKPRKQMFSTPFKHVVPAPLKRVLTLCTPLILTLPDCKTDPGADCRQARNWWRLWRTFPFQESSLPVKICGWLRCLVAPLKKHPLWTFVKMLSMFVLSPFPSVSLCCWPPFLYYCLCCHSFTVVLFASLVLSPFILTQFLFANCFVEWFSTDLFPETFRFDLLRNGLSRVCR